jgi:hypothetical protein
VSAVRVEGRPQQSLVLVENVAVAFSKLFDESRRPLDIREKEGDRAARQICHRERA